LESLNLTVERVRAQVVRIVGSGEEVTSGQIPFTPRAKKVLELALREALSLGHNWIGTEHILLGLARENEGVAARILPDFDADSEKIRNDVIRMLGPKGQRAAQERAVTRAVESGRPVTPAGPEFVRHVGWALQVAAPIAQRARRGVDDGDLLLGLTETTETLSGWAMKRLGVDRDALAQALDEVRELEREIESTMAAKEKAIEEQRFAEASEMKDEERRLRGRRHAPAPPNQGNDPQSSEDG
jgi:ATP-dependent Clp protease ATP-binding subunit ClpA